MIPGLPYLYHHCFGYAPEASICLSVSSDSADTFETFHGEVVRPEEGHIFSVVYFVYHTSADAHRILREFLAPLGKGTPTVTGHEDRSTPE